MIINKKAREELIKNTDELNMKFVNAIGRATDGYREAKTVGDIMNAKRAFLQELITTLPLGTYHCYFCLLKKDNCHSCKYGKKHGICIKKDSDYGKVMHARNDLLGVIVEKYHKQGEEYL